MSEAVGVGEVDRLGPLVPVDSEEVRRFLADPRRTPAAGVVPGTRAFDLDHLGAEVGEHHRGVRAGEDAAEVGNHQVVEGATRLRGHLNAASPVSALPMDSWCISEVPS